MEGTATVNVEPIFITIGEALSIGFRRAEERAPIKGSTDSALRHLKEERYGLPATTIERRVNKLGLNDQEFRAQCVLVVEAVARRLSGHEAAAITARFTTFPPRRAQAVRELQTAYRALCTTQNTDALLALIWGLYVPAVIPLPNERPEAFNARRKRRELEWSARSLEKQYGIGHNILNRDKALLRKLLTEVELQAQNKLEGYFVRIGLLQPPEEG